MERVVHALEKRARGRGRERKAARRGKLVRASRQATRASAPWRAWPVLVRMMIS